MTQDSDKNAEASRGEGAGLKLVYDPEDNLVLISVPADFPVASLLDAYDAYWRPHPDFREDANVIWDVSALVVEPDEARQTIQQGLLNLSGLQREGRAAYVASADPGFGLIRMFVSQADYHNPNLRGVFRSVEDARAWLEEGDSTT